MIFAMFARMRVPHKCNGRLGSLIHTEVVIGSPFRGKNPISHLNTLLLLLLRILDPRRKTCSLSAAELNKIGKSPLARGMIFSSTFQALRSSTAADSGVGTGPTNRATKQNLDWMYSSWTSLSNLKLLSALFTVELSGWGLQVSTGRNGSLWPMTLEA